MKLPHETIETVRIGDNVLVVYKWGKLTKTSSPRIWENVELFDRAGKKIWTVNGMDKCRYWNSDVDVFVEIKERNDRLQLTSFSGNDYDLDLKNGKVTYFEFHK